jgi:3-oxoacyl-[acyl-carrier-protein] synthase III
VIIAGAAETDEIGRLPNISTLGLHIEAARNAVADAGLTMRDIDGIATVSAPGPVQVAHALGIYPDSPWVIRIVCTLGTRSPRSGPATRRRS